MPSKTRKLKKKEGSIEHRDKNPLTLNKATVVPDNLIEASLHANLMELAQHSHTCFEYACKNMTRTGKGNVGTRQRHPPRAQKKCIC
jgi:hypothetical protein